MKTAKKAQSMSMNVIIVAVLALIVLVVLLFIFSSKLNIFGKGVSSCNGVCEGTISATNPGSAICEAKNVAGTTKKYAFNPSGSCPSNGACCIVAFAET